MIAAPVVAAPTVVATALFSRGNDDDGSLLFMEEFMENVPVELGVAINSVYS